MGWVYPQYKELIDPGTFQKVGSKPCDLQEVDGTASDAAAICRLAAVSAVRRMVTWNGLKFVGVLPFHKSVGSFRFWDVCMWYLNFLSLCNEIAAILVVIKWSWGGSFSTQNSFHHSPTFLSLYQRWERKLWFTAAFLSFKPDSHNILRSNLPAPKNWWPKICWAPSRR